MGVCGWKSQETCANTLLHTTHHAPHKQQTRNKKPNTNTPKIPTNHTKVYPTLVIRGTGLYELWKAGLYRNYAPDRLVDLVARCALLRCLRVFECFSCWLLLVVLRVRGAEKRGLYCDALLNTPYPFNKSAKKTQTRQHLKPCP